jgi:carbonic anhydrase
MLALSLRASLELNSERLISSATLGVPRESACLPSTSLDFSSFPSSREALRSIVISQRLLGTREIAVFHHTGCGMLTFSTDQLKAIVKDAAPGDTKVEEEVEKFDSFLEFSELEQSVKGDVEFLQGNPLVLKETKITGWTYDVQSASPPSTRMADVVLIDLSSGLIRSYSLSSDTVSIAP